MPVDYVTMLGFWWVTENDTRIAMQNGEPFIPGSAFSVMNYLFLEKKFG